MLLSNMENIKNLTDSALRTYIPLDCDEVWMEKFIDKPRFGWDWDALEKGFFKPFHKLAADHPAKIRPVLAGLLLEGVGEKAENHADLLMALECFYLSFVMVDRLHNERNLCSDISNIEVSVPLPAWVTISYNIRQFMPVFIMRQNKSLTKEKKYWLSSRFSRVLFRHGVINALEHWGFEQGINYSSGQDYADYLRSYLGHLNYSLACDIVSAAMNLDSQASSNLHAAGVELYLSHRLKSLEQGFNNKLFFLGSVSPEQEIRWLNGVEPQKLLELASECEARSMSLAHSVDAAIPEILIGFDSVFQFKNQ